jgi:DNA-directed RNA polymerase subunit beta'
VDGLRGLKENVTIGNLIPAGTGLSRYKNLRVYGEEEEVQELLVREMPVVETMQTA